MQEITPQEIQLEILDKTKKDFRPIQIKMAAAWIERVIQSGQEYNKAKLTKKELESISLKQIDKRNNELMKELDYFMDKGIKKIYDEIFNKYIVNSDLFPIGNLTYEKLFNNSITIALNSENKNSELFSFWRELIDRQNVLISDTKTYKIILNTYKTDKAFKDVEIEEHRHILNQVLSTLAQLSAINSLFKIIFDSVGIQAGIYKVFMYDLKEIIETAENYNKRLKALNIGIYYSFTDYKVPKYAYDEIYNNDIYDTIKFSIQNIINKLAKEIDITIYPIEDEKENKAGEDNGKRH